MIVCRTEGVNLRRLGMQKKKTRYLLAFVVDVDPERRVFLLEAVERTRKVGRFGANRLDG
jgi:hypothetical protein